MAKKKPSARTKRRAQDRQAEKLARDAARVFELSPGGSSEHPIEVGSASEVESHAAGIPCPVCLGQLTVLEHAARTVAGARLRVVHARCRSCGRARSLWFRLGPLLS